MIFPEEARIFTFILRMFKKHWILPVRKLMASFPEPMGQQKRIRNQMCWLCYVPTFFFTHRPNSACGPPVGEPALPASFLPIKKKQPKGAVHFRTTYHRLCLSISARLCLFQPDDPIPDGTRSWLGKLDDHLEDKLVCMRTAVPITACCLQYAVVIGYPSPIRGLCYSNTPSDRLTDTVLSFCNV